MNEVVKHVLFVLESLKSEDWYFGRTITQKVFYFLKEAYSFELPFKYTFYHYGPFSRDLQTMIDKLELYGLVKSESDPSGKGVKIQISIEGQEQLKSYTPPDGLNDKIQLVCELIKEKKPKELELLSTIHFVFNVHKPKDESELVGSVNYLKSRFKPEEIVSKVKYLQEKAVIPTSW